MYNDEWLDDPYLQGGNNPDPTEVIIAIVIIVAVAILFYTINL